MGMLDGLKDSLKNPLIENNEDADFAMESDFEVALEKAIDTRLSPADIAAILNGDDDVDDSDDDLDDSSDDIDKDINSLESYNRALESTMNELGIDTAADDLEDEDLELDPEGDDEILSEEALLDVINNMDNATEGLNMDTAKMIKDADVTQARSLVKNAKKEAKRGNYKGAADMLQEADDLICGMKEKVAKANEPKGFFQKLLSHLTPIFTLLPTGETRVTSVSVSTNGDFGVGTTTTYYEDSLSRGTDSGVKRKLQEKFNLLLRNIRDTKSKYKTLAKTQKTDLTMESFFEDDSVYLIASESDKVADTGDSSIPENNEFDLDPDNDGLDPETGDASIPENTEEPTPDGDEKEIDDLDAECEALIAAYESSDDECYEPELDEDASTEEVEYKYNKDKNADADFISKESDDESEDDDDETSLESILNNLMENPI